MSELKLQTVISGHFADWVLPEIEENGQDLQVHIKTSPILQDQISFDSRSNTISFKGDYIEGLTSETVAYI